MKNREKTTQASQASEEESRFGRRGFLGAVTASFALAGSEGCRRAVEHIVPYSAAPEEVIPGRPLHYATALARRGDALGVVVESHEGRPTKIEGNPRHPSSLGAADLLAQATILELYDPDRARTPRQAGAKSTWEAFEADWKARAAALGKEAGSRLRVLFTPSISPTILRMRAALGARFPKMKAHVYAPAELGNDRAGAALAYGAPATVVHAFDQARVIAALDSDFLQTEAGSVRAQKLFAASRRVSSPRDVMSRLYVVEPAMTTTGMAADHRFALPASQVQGFAASLAAELMSQGLAFGELGASLAKRAAAGPAGAPKKLVAALAKDLIANGAQSIVLVGSGQPPIVHALGHAINEALGAVGTTVFVAPATGAAAGPGPSDIAELAAAMRAGEVDSLFVLGGNPVYDAPADVGFAEALTHVTWSARLSSLFDETAASCRWHLPEAHELEAWGDLEARDGTVSVQQPLIAPLFGGRSELELLAMMAGAAPSGRDLVKETLREALLEAHGLRACAATDAATLPCTDGNGQPVAYPLLALDHDWKKALNEGVLGRMRRSGAAPVFSARAVAKALEGAAPAEAPSAGRFEVDFAPDAKMLDGRYANNSWLEELPDPVTKVTWDNAALMAPATARALGVETGDLLKVAEGGRSIQIAAYVLPGTAENTLVLPMGWGRTRAGRIGNRRGFDVYPLRTTRTMSFAGGASVTKTGGRYELARAQLADSMEGRPLARSATLDAYRAQPHFAELERAPRRSLPLWTDVDYSKGHQWGMSIDLNACTGCSACVVACQAENNIPVVGKEEVAKGRDMQWIRLDRYFEDPPPGAGEGASPEVALQPVACVQCEEAPCENVCPVAALEHSAEGLSEVTYNRCIGTRYCANNCPYKVRRFNYLNWHNDGVWKETGGLPESLQLQQNPDVTVRFRGVIEKCTYCVQRIQGSRLSAKAEGRTLKDGDIATACQQTCPADAIVFGDLNDMNSRLAKLVTGDRRYALLEEIGTKPRTTYLAKIKNPNPELV